MKSTYFRLFPVLSLVACMAVSQSAHADWIFSNGTSATSNSGDPSVSLTGVYASNNSSGVVNGSWTAGTLSPYSGGLGMTTGTETGTNQPGHALDNTGNTEGVLLNFGSASIALTSVGLGYVAQCINNTTGQAVGSASSGSCPSGTTLKENTTGMQEDISVFRWTGTTAPTLVGKSATTGMAGWELVGNYGTIEKDTTSPYSPVNASGLSSSWWLITAYNSGFAQTSGVTQNVGTSDNGNDFFKLYAVAGTNCSKTNCGGGGGTVPEPGSLALAGMALFGLAYTRRQLKERRG